MNESFLSQNLKYISEYNPELAVKIAENTELTGNYQINESKSGDPVLFIDKIPVHNLIDPVEEAIEVFEKLQNSEKSSINFVFGFELGYLPDRLFKSCAGKIIVYEPDIDILRIAFELFDFSHLLGSKKLKIANTFEDIEKIYGEFFFDKSKSNLVFLDYYKRCKTEKLNALIEKSSLIYGIYQSNYSNLFHKSEAWNTSTVRNIDKITDHQDLHELKGILSGKPAVIISAGPSLDKNIQELKKYRDKAVVFCVGTALKSAVKYGINPDFAVIVEFYDSTVNQVKDVDLSGTNMILQLSACSSLYGIKTKNTFNYYADNDNTSIWLSKVWGVPLEGYKNLGTVSINTLFSAKMLGCDPIILIGQDLAYTDGNCYSGGSIYSDFKLLKNESEETVSTDLEKMSKDLNISVDEIKSHIGIIGTNLLKVKGHNNEILTTRSDFALFIKYFEKIALEYGQEVKLINSTEGGAYLEGFEHIPLTEALEKYAKEKISINESLSVLKKDRNGLISKKKNILKKLENTLEKLENIKTLSDGVILSMPDLVNLSRSVESFIPETQEKFLYYTKKYSDVYSKIRKILEDDAIISGNIIKELFYIERTAREFENNEKELRAFFVQSLSFFLKIHQQYGNLKSLLETEISELKNSLDKSLLEY
jgi:hypothetical protein